MDKMLHISAARSLLDSGEPVSMTVVKKNGEAIDIDQAVSISCDFRRGFRRIKLLRSRRIMMVYDVMITRINDFEIFL